MKASLPVILLFSLLAIGCGGGSLSNAPPPPPPTITGHWQGTIVSAVVSGASAGVSGNLVQGITNPDGSIQFSGTLNLTNSCITTLTITNGVIAGGQFSLAGGAQDGTTLNVTATLNAADTALNGTYSDTGGTVCNSDHGSFSMTKQ